MALYTPETFFCPPQSRLSLSSTLPVMTADIPAVSTLYCLPYLGLFVPVWSGGGLFAASIGDSGISLSINDVTNFPTATMFDVYYNPTTSALCAVPWGGTTSRVTGSAIVRKGGLWVNNASVTAYVGATSLTLAAQMGTLLGSFYTTAAAQTSMQFGINSASGGAANVLGLYNAYNRARVVSGSSDSTASWTYATATWRAANGNNNNRITFIDGLQESSLKATYQVEAAATSGIPLVGVNFDSTSNAPSPFRKLATGAVGGLTCVTIKAPQLGLHYAQAMEQAQGAATVTFTAASEMLLSLELEM